MEDFAKFCGLLRIYELYYEKGVGRHASFPSRRSVKGNLFPAFFNYLKLACDVAHRRDNDSGKKMPSSSQRRERRLDRAVIMMMPIIAKFALVLMPPSPRLLIRVKNAFTV